jgi:hypothetical protein
VLADRRRAALVCWGVIVVVGISVVLDVVALVDSGSPGAGLMLALAEAAMLSVWQTERDCEPEQRRRLDRVMMFVALFLCVRASCVHGG